MTAENQSLLRFSVEESVWFQKGQEVANLVSISLYPDITIEEHDQYITIRGALQLTGEYRIDDEFENGEEELPGFTYGRVINEVKQKVDGISELKHRFPVDITIPANRIQNIDDVYVSIDSFDYELPGNRCLQLVADLSISGIYNDLEQINVTSRAENNTNQATKEDQEDTESLQSNEATSSLFQNQQDEVEEAEEAQIIRAVSEEKHDLEDLEEDDIFTPIEVEARREVYQEDTSSLEGVLQVEAQNRNSNVSPEFELKGRDDSQSSVVTLQTQSSNAEKEAAKEINRVPEKRDENALYLTKIFAEDEEQDFSKLKMYIVQNGDTIDTIAERYDVSVQNLVKVNELDQERSVYEGQILYISLQEKNKLYS